MPVDDTAFPKVSCARLTEPFAAVHLEHNECAIIFFYDALPSNDVASPVIRLVSAYPESWRGDLEPPLNLILFLIRSVFLCSIEHILSKY